MPTRIILVRHGDSHHRAGRLVGGPRGCRGLTLSGQVQSAALGRRLSLELSVPPTSIYCSTLPRAIETVEILADTLGLLEVVQDCDLCTWHTPPEADGRLWAEFRQEHGLEGGGIFRPFEAGNESWSELVSRTGRALEKIAAQHHGETTLIVGHAETVRASLIVFGGLPLALPLDVNIAPASITEWRTDGDPAAWPRPRWMLARLNDHAHLPQPLATPGD